MLSCVFLLSLRTCGRMGFFFLQATALVHKGPTRPVTNEGPHDRYDVRYESRPPKVRDLVAVPGGAAYRGGNPTFFGMSANLSDGENMIIGALSSFGTVGLLQPTLYLKNARAQGLEASFDPRVLYRGVGVNLANEMGQLSLQFGVTGFLKRFFPETPLGELTAAASAGGLVAFYASPCELMMVQQQRYGLSLVHTVSNVFSRFGVIYSLSRGLSLSIARDAIFVGGMFGVTPVFYALLTDRLGLIDQSRGSSEGSSSDGDRSSGGSGGGSSNSSSSSSSGVGSGGGGGKRAMASLVSSMLGGILGSILSHPLDVLNTCLKGDLEKANYRGIIDATRRLYREGGVARLMSGATWRGINITATCWIANECSLRLPEW